MYKKTDFIIRLFIIGIMAIGCNEPIQSADVEITVIPNIPPIQEQFPLLCKHMANSTIMGNITKELQEHYIATPRLSACESLERVLSAQSQTADAIYPFFEDPTLLGTIAAFFRIDSCKESLKRKIGLIVVNEETRLAFIRGDIWGKTVNDHYSLVESEFEQFCIAGQAIRRAQENTERQKRRARLIPAFETTTMSPEEVDARNRRYQRPGGILH